MPHLLQPQQTIVDANGQQFILLPMKNAEHTAVTQVVNKFSRPVGIPETDSYEDKGEVDAFKEDSQNTEVFLMLIVWIVLH